MIGFAQESYTIMEGQPTVTLTVTSNGVNRDTVVVVFSTLSGSAEGIQFVLSTDFQLVASS